MTIKYYVSLNIEVSNFLFPDLDSFTKRDSLFSTKTIVINKTMWLIIKLYSCWPRFLTQSFEQINEDHFFFAGGGVPKSNFIYHDGNLHQQIKLFICQVLKYIFWTNQLDHVRLCVEIYTTWTTHLHLPTLLIGGFRVSILHYKPVKLLMAWKCWLCSQDPPLRKPTLYLIFHYNVWPRGQKS